MAILLLVPLGIVYGIQTSSYSSPREQIKNK